MTRAAIIVSAILGILGVDRTATVVQVSLGSAQVATRQQMIDRHSLAECP
jgi:hypothetical protein